MNVFDAANTRYEGCFKTATIQVLHWLQSLISCW